MRHKHYHLIVEWADGKRIQQKLYNEWIACDKPSWNVNSEYRVDPDPVPDFAVSARVMFSDLYQGIEFSPSPIFIKLTELNENTASIFVVPVFLNEYSNPPTGRLELSASPGIKGLHPLILTVTGIC